MNSATQSVLRFSGSPGEDWRTAHVSCRSVVLSPFRGRTNCQLTAEGGIQNCGGAQTQIGPHFAVRNRDWFVVYLGTPTMPRPYRAAAAFVASPEGVFGAFRNDRPPQLRTPHCQPVVVYFEHPRSRHHIERESLNVRDSRGFCSLLEASRPRHRALLGDAKAGRNPPTAPGSAAAGRICSSPEDALPSLWLNRTIIYER